MPAAGITRDSLAVKFNKETGKAEPYSIATFRQVMEVNLIGAMATIDAAVELMTDGGGQIVGISSVAGTRGLREGTVYAATKAFVSNYLAGPV